MDGTVPTQAQGSNWPLIAGITGTGILLGMLIFAIFTGIGSSSSCDPSASGAECSQAVDLSNPHVQELVKSLQALSQPADYLAQHSADLTPLRQQLSAMVTGLNSKSSDYASIPDPDHQLLTLAQKMLGEVAEIQNAPNSPSGQTALQAFTTDRKDLNQLLATLISTTSTPKGGFSLPVDPKLIIGWNRTAHDASLSHPQSSNQSHGLLLGIQRSGGCVPLTTIQLPCQYGDATDIDLPAGTPVYAAFSGTVTKTGTVHKNSTTLGWYDILESADGNYVAAYLHLGEQGRPTPGTSVKAGDIIGNVYDMRGSHVHFELWYKTGSGWQAVTATDHGDGKIGHDVWMNDVKKLGFSNS